MNADTYRKSKCAKIQAATQAYRARRLELLAEIEKLTTLLGVERDELARLDNEYITLVDGESTLGACVVKPPRKATP